MKIVKRQSKGTYKSKVNGKEYHYYNYYLELENGKRIQVKCAFDKDYVALDTVCVYER